MNENINQSYGSALEEKCSEIFKEKGFEYEREICEIDIVAFNSNYSSTLFLIECTGHDSSS